MVFKFNYAFINQIEDKNQEIFRFGAALSMTGKRLKNILLSW